MIEIKEVTGNLIKAKVSGQIKEGDFETIRPKIEDILKQNGSIRLLMDATAFEGWANFKAAQQHFAFVKERQKKVECIALIAGHAWQHWLAAMASVFVHPEIKVFAADKRSEAENWLNQPHSVAA